ncbi:hypothetical protein N0V88_003363 [Collariella sp. IMI 366227]|nr:hypothetical protein N0V88_003363 [Collariella sp. IMI 366227]
MWLPRPFYAAAVALLAGSSLVQHAAAQVHTDCNPMNSTCPPDPAFGTDYNFVFNITPNAEAWEKLPGRVPIRYNQDTGAAFTISQQGDSPTIRSKFYYFWGRTEIWLKAAKGTGIISSVMLLSDDLDEIDWEFFGGNSTHAETNFFGKGIQDHTKAIYHPVAGSVTDDYHNYTMIWTKEFLDFYIDGQQVRRLEPKDANNTYNYPQTPCRLSLGIWAGGTTDFNQGPFTMFVKNAHVTDYSSGKEYVYSDHSGSWESIKIVAGNSTIKEVVNAPPEKTISEKWRDLPTGSKIAIFASIGGFFALMFLTGIFYCIRQRRRGAREAKVAETKAQAERLELERFKKDGVDPDSFASHASEYNGKEMRRGGLADSDSYSVSTTPAVGVSPLGGGSNWDPNTPAVAASPLGGGSNWDPASAALAAAGAGAVGGAAAASTMRTPQSPSVYSDRQASTRSPAPSGMMSPSQHYSQQPNRSYSNPNAQMRMASPAPSQPDYHGRSASPAQLAHPQPQRSFTAGGYGEETGQGGSYGGQDQGVLGNGGGGGGYR